jgi:phytoene dehydrogenase-like protein
LADYQLVIIGGGLSGLAAGIRAARFGLSTLILEQHSLPGGLNSYYHRQGYLLETGLHAMTNFAPVRDKRAPLNRLFRQLKLSRKRFVTREQFGSQIIFPQAALDFGNDPDVLIESVRKAFPGYKKAFIRLVREMEGFDPFSPAPWRSACAFLHERLDCLLLEKMLLLPLMVYGNAEERDMDLAQFAIMFRALFLEGFFRPEKTIREFLNLLLDQYRAFGGELRFRTPVDNITVKDGRAVGVRLKDGTHISADQVVSTVGLPATVRLAAWSADPARYVGQMSFMETISLLPEAAARRLSQDRTILFYAMDENWEYGRPDGLIDPSWGVVCFPENFHGIARPELCQLRVTNAASYERWHRVAHTDYSQAKEDCVEQSRQAVSKIVGNYGGDIVYQDSFTPLTIERYTAKDGGAVYGSPTKIRDGRTPFDNLYIAGTDQGFLGIVGSMLSGVTIVNQHILR